MPLTDDEIQMLARLTVRCRPHHAPRWDEAGTAAMIRKIAARSLPEVMRACAAAAADPKNRTPGVIPQPGPHWRGDIDLPPAPVAVAELCDVCGREDDARHPRDHKWRSVRGSRPAPAYGSPAAARARSLVVAAQKAADPEVAAGRRRGVEALVRMARGDQGVAKGPGHEAGSES